MDHQPLTPINQIAPQLEVQPPQPAVTPARSHQRSHSLRRLQRAAGNQAVQRFVQAKLTVSQPGDPYEREAEQVAGMVMRMPDPARAAPPRISRLPAATVQRKKCACGGEAGQDGECAECRKKKEAVARMATTHFPVRLMRMPASGSCPDCNKKRPLMARGPPRGRSPPLRRSVLPRACGSNCRKRPRRTRSRKGELDILPVADSGGIAASSPGLETTLSALPSSGRPLPAPVRDYFEPRLGYDLTPVRVHTGGRAGHAARRLNALAFTSGQDIYFAPGRYQPHTIDGRRLLAHELTHTIQQGEGRASPCRGPPSVQRYSLDEFVDDATAVGESVVSGVESAVNTAGEALTTAGETLVAASETAVAAGEAAITWLASTAGQAALAAANQLVGLLGGTVTVTASGIIIRIPAVTVCSLHTLALPGPAFDHTVPLFSGTLPITSNLLINGSLSANFALQSGLNLNFGPCLLGPTTITIDPLRNHYSASGQFSAPAAFNLAANASQMLQGQVSLTVLIPIGGIIVPLTVPVAGLSAGLLETLVMMGTGMLTIPATLSYSAGVISFSTTPRLDLVGMVDFLLAAGGTLSLLGSEICSLVWPFYRWTRAGAATLALGLTVSYNTGSGALIGAGSAAFTGFSIGSVVSGFSNFDPQIDCPGLDSIMDWLCQSGLIPSTPCVGAGPAPRPPGTTCPIGPPLAPDVKNPGIPSGSLCRGVCGPNCARSCQDIGDIIIYVPTAAGDHYICTYPNAIECGSNQGCRDHDACYDCCAASGYPSIGDICHLACDCTCQQTYGAGTCIGWALGFGPFDSTMIFSDPPYAVGPLPGLPPSGNINVTPVIPTGDCCSAAQTAGLDNGDFGGVICCNNVKHACVWSSNIPATNPTARGIIAGCVGEHEAVHLNHVDCTGAALERPPFKPSVSPAAGECAAYLVEIACYERRIGECGSDADCCREVQAELAFARSQAVVNCGSAPPGPPLPCPAPSATRPGASACDPPSLPDVDNIFHHGTDYDTAHTLQSADIGAIGGNDFGRGFYTHSRDNWCLAKEWALRISRGKRGWGVVTFPIPNDVWQEEIVSSLVFQNPQDQPANMPTNPDTGRPFSNWREFVEYNKRFRRRDLPEWPEFNIIQGPLWGRYENDPSVQQIVFTSSGVPVLNRPESKALRVVVTELF